MVAAAPIWLLIRGCTASVSEQLADISNPVSPLALSACTWWGQAAGSSSLKLLLLQHCATCGITSQFWPFDKLISICEAPAAQHPSVLWTLCHAVLCEGAGLSGAHPNIHTPYKFTWACVLVCTHNRRVMMQIGAENVGGNYAIALVELASEADDLEKVHQDMDALASILAENAEVILVRRMPHQPP